MSLASRPSRILSQTRLHDPYVVTELEAPGIASRIRPGQFVMVRVPGVQDPLLGRPFSVFEVGSPGPDGEPRSLSILYSVVGRGTALFAGKRPGDDLLVLGPLGRGFDVEAAPARALLVAGGIGIAAFPPLCRALAARKSSVRLLYGAQSAADLVAVDRFEAAGARVELATDDGTRGTKGFVTQLLEEALLASPEEAPGTIVYACGPTPMMRRVRAIAGQAGVRCVLALESRMACGFGVCLGCAVPSAREPGTYRLVCTDGPCIGAEEVLL